jgi:hypothetical protein
MVLSNLIPPDELGVRYIDQIYDTTTNNREMIGFKFRNEELDGMVWAEGKVYQENVSIGPLTVPSQAIQAASAIAYDYKVNPLLEGFIGLGFVSFLDLKTEGHWILIT